MWRLEAKAVCEHEPKAEVADLGTSLRCKPERARGGGSDRWRETEVEVEA